MGVSKRNAAIAEWVGSDAATTYSAECKAEAEASRLRMADYFADLSAEAEAEAEAGFSLAGGGRVYFE